MTQYSNRMIFTHWLTLVLLVAAWFLGDSLSELTDTGSATLAAYQLHLVAGGVVLLLTLLRLFFRSKDGVPKAVGNMPMDKVAKGVHHLLYTLLFVLPLSGMATVFSSDAGRALLSGDAKLLPGKDVYEHVFAHSVHETLVTVLLVLVAIHVLGALKHQFIMKDGLIKRMTPH